MEDLTPCEAQIAGHCISSERNNFHRMTVFSLEGCVMTWTEASFGYFFWLPWRCC